MLQWDGVENKTSVAVYVGGAVVLLWLSSTIVSAVNAVPVVRLPLLQHSLGIDSIATACTNMCLPAAAAQAAGAGGPGLLRLVRVPVPALQGEQGCRGGPKSVLLYRDLWPCALHLCMGGLLLLTGLFTWSPLLTI